MGIGFSCTTIFCDDIRHELNGKISLMGVYTGNMYVPDFPITVSKLCSLFELHIPIECDYTGDAVVSVLKGAEKIGSVTLTVPQSPPQTEAPHGKPYAFQRVVGAMEFPAITFSEPTLVDVNIQVDGQSRVAGRLWVTKFPQPTEHTVTA